MADKLGYVVEIVEHTHHSEYSDEQRGSWETSSSHDFKSIRKSNKTTDYPDVVSDLDIKPGEACFVVWVEYSTGNSFGTAYRGSAESVAVFINYEDAQNLKKAIENPVYIESRYSTIEFTTSYGEVMEIYTGSWTGYFETLEDVNIEGTWMHGV